MAANTLTVHVSELTTGDLIHGWYWPSEELAPVRSVRPDVHGYGHMVYLENGQRDTVAGKVTITRPATSA